MDEETRAAGREGSKEKRIRSVSNQRDKVVVVVGLELESYLVRVLLGKALKQNVSHLRV